MNPACPRKPTHLDDDALLAQTAAVNTSHQLSLTLLLEHLAEVETRMLYAKRGHASMHRYCVRELNMSEDVAYVRLRVARLGRRLPAVLEHLADGRLHLTGARILCPLLTEANHREILAEATRLSKADIEQLAARLAPKPDVPTRVRRLPSPRAPKAPAVEAETPLARADGETAGAARLDASASASAGGARLDASAAADAPRFTLDAPRPKVQPLAPERFEVRFTASAEWMAKLAEVTALLSHAVPDGDLPTVLARALDLAHDQLVKRRFGAAALRPVEAKHSRASDTASALRCASDEVASSGQSGPNPAATRPSSASEPAGSAAPEQDASSSSAGSSSRVAPSSRTASAPRDPSSSGAVPRPGEASRPGDASSSSTVPRPGDASRTGVASSSSAARRPRVASSSRSAPESRAASSSSVAPRPCDAAWSSAAPRPPAESSSSSAPAPCDGETTVPGGADAQHHHEVSSSLVRDCAGARNRYIPAAVRAEVWRRDGGGCTYVDPVSGRACGERRFIELHHVRPFARGGEHSVEGLTLRCRVHNAWAARVDFGAEHMAAFARRDEA